MEWGAGTGLGGKYVLLERIGSGGVGVVYRAAEPARSRWVAVKILRRDLVSNSEAVRRFHDEVIAASRFAHHNAVGVIDSGRADDGTPYLVMEHVRGDSLRALLARERWLPIARVVAIARQVLAGLHEAHRAGVIHADIKLDNILVEPTRDGGERIKIIDFGIARLPGDVAPARSGARADVTVSGTPEYMAPETIRGDRTGPAADQYAVGVVIYELLTGATPFAGGTNEEILQSHLADPVVPPSLRRAELDVTPELDAAVVRALAKDPAARFVDARAFSDALAAAPVRSVVHAAAATAPRVGADATTKVLSPHATGRVSIDRLRSAIGTAIIRGELDGIAAAYLALSEALAVRHRTDDAIRELREGLDVLTVGGHVARAGSAAVCRILICLVALEASRAVPRRSACASR